MHTAPLAVKNLWKNCIPVSTQNSVFVYFFNLSLTLEDKRLLEILLKQIESTDWKQRKAFLQINLTSVHAIFEESPNDSISPRGHKIREAQEGKLKNNYVLNLSKIKCRATN